MSDTKFETGETTLKPGVCDGSGVFVKCGHELFVLKRIDAAPDGSLLANCVVFNGEGSTRLAFEVRVPKKIDALTNKQAMEFLRNEASRLWDKHHAAFVRQQSILRTLVLAESPDDFIHQMSEP